MNSEKKLIASIITIFIFFLLIICYIFAKNYNIIKAVTYTTASVVPVEQTSTPIYKTEIINNSEASNQVNSSDKIEIVDDIEDFDKIDEDMIPSDETPKKYYIKVNYTQNVVTIYTSNKKGQFIVPVKAMVCSTGVSTPTSGVYKMSDRGTWGLMVGNVWAQYYSRIDGCILFHSVPYTKKAYNALEYWEYDKLGTTASAGCVRLTVKDAKWIYDNCPAGTQVEFYSDTNPGPLGKPTAQKISGESANLRGWDPTDLHEDNPWNEVV